MWSKAILKEKAENEDDYDEFIKIAHQNWQNWSGTGGYYQRTSALDSASGKKDTFRNSVKREASQENLIKENDNQDKKRGKSQFKKLDMTIPAYNPKNISTYTAKRTPLTKAFNGVLNDSNSFSTSSFKTATSNQNKGEDLYLFNREAHLGPWVKNTFWNNKVYILGSRKAKRRQ